MIDNIPNHIARVPVKLVGVYEADLIYGGGFSHVE